MEWVLINNKNIMKYTKPQLEEMALNEDEYNLILKKLGRVPNYLELGYSVLYGVNIVGINIPKI